VNRGQSGDRSGDGDRVNTRHGHPVTVARAKVRNVNVSTGWTGSIDGGDRAVWLSDKGNEVAAESRVMGVHNREGERRRQGSIDSVAATPDYISCCFSGERVGCGYGAMPTR